MITIDDAKAMARRLRGAMESRGFAASATLGRQPDAGSRFTESIPVLRSLDERKCRAFYCGFLGFAVDFEHRFAPHMPLYLGLVRGPVKLHLSEHRGDATTGSALFVWMAGIEAYRRELADRGSEFQVPEIADQPWGREIGIVDPFGNRLRFCERPTG